MSLYKMYFEDHVLEIVELPILILFDEQGIHRQQVLQPVFSCFPDL